jgi:voltage-gated potassium channel Kch
MFKPNWHFRFHFSILFKVVCEVLDRKFIRYIVFEVNPSKVIDARNRGLPVFFGDVSRPEVLQNFNVGNAKVSGWARLTHLMTKTRKCAFWV